MSVNPAAPKLTAAPVVGTLPDGNKFTVACQDIDIGVGLELEMACGEATAADPTDFFTTNASGSSFTDANNNDQAYADILTLCGFVNMTPDPATYAGAYLTSHTDAENWTAIKTWILGTLMPGINAQLAALYPATNAVAPPSGNSTDLVSLINNFLTAHGLLTGPTATSPAILTAPTFTG